MANDTEGASIDVVIPAYDPEPAWIDAAVDSCLADDSIARVVVVDDGSSPPCTPSASGDPRVEVLTQTNRGPSAARNAGIEATQASLVLFLDSDDLLIPDVLRDARAFLETSGADGLQGGRMELLPDGTTRLCPVPDHLEGRSLQPADAWLPVPFFSTSGLLVRRHVFEAGLRFDETIRIQEDRELLHRIAEAHELWIWPRPLVRMRRHEDGQNLTGPRHFERRIADHVRLLDRHCGPDADAVMRENWRRATRWLVNNAQKVGVGDEAWSRLRSAMRERGWPVPWKTRLRRALGTGAPPPRA